MKFKNLADGINRFMQSRLCLRFGDIFVIAGAASLGYCIKGIKDQKERQKNLETIQLITKAFCVGADSVSENRESGDDAESTPEEEEKASR